MKGVDQFDKSSFEIAASPKILSERTVAYLGRIAAGSKNVLSRVKTIGDEISRPINQQHGMLRLVTMEGYMRPKQAKYFHELLSVCPNIQSVAESGFNGGHSSYTFLASRSDVKVVSFDIAEHSYVSSSKEFIDNEFPYRHLLVVGDSKNTIQEYAQSNDETFDLIFIDGGHDYNTASSDLMSFKKLSHEATIVIMDDYIPGVYYGEGPVQAWDEAIEKGFVTQSSMHTGDNHRWVVGSYNFD